jgi:hypothetical protein
MWAGFEPDTSFFHSLTLPTTSLGPLFCCSSTVLNFAILMCQLLGAYPMNRNFATYWGPRPTTWAPIDTPGVGPLCHVPHGHKGQSATDLEHSTSSEDLIWVSFDLSGPGCPSGGGLAWFFVPYSSFHQLSFLFNIVHRLAWFLVQILFIFIFINFINSVFIQSEVLTKIQCCVGKIP